MKNLQEYKKGFTLAVTALLDNLCRDNDCENARNRYCQFDIDTSRDLALNLANAIVPIAGIIGNDAVSSVIAVGKSLDFAREQACALEGCINLASKQGITFARKQIHDICLSIDKAIEEATVFANDLIIYLMP